MLLVGFLDNEIGFSLGLLFLGDTLVGLLLLGLLLADFLSLFLVLLLLLLVGLSDLLVHLCDDLSVGLVLGSLLCSINNSFVNGLHGGSHLLFLADNGGNHGFLGGNGHTSGDILSCGRTRRLGLSTGDSFLLLGGGGGSFGNSGSSSSRLSLVNCLFDKLRILALLTLSWTLSRGNGLLVFEGVDLSIVLISGQLVLRLKPVDKVIYG